MRLVSLSLKGYRQFLEHTQVRFPVGLTGICGANGVGKSKLIEAIGYAMFGPHRSLMPTSDKESDIASVCADGNVATEVCLELEVRGEHYRIRRTRKARECRIELLMRNGVAEPVATVLASTPSEVTKKVVELFGITPEAYLRTFVARQKEVAGIQSIKSQGDRQRLINRLIGIAQIEKALSIAEGERKQRNNTLETKVAEEGDAADVGLAEAHLHDAETSLADATELEEQCAAALSEASQSTKEGRQDKENWNKKAAAAQAIRVEIGALEKAAPDLETGIEGAAKHRDECAAARALVEAANTVLEATEGVPDEIALHETLSRLASARRQLHAATDSLDTAHDNLELHQSCEQKLREAVHRVRTLQEKAAQQQETLTLVRATMQETERQTNAIGGRLQNVQEMGASGVCERCGQRLGENLAVALDSLTADLRNAKEQFGAATLEEQSRSQSLQAATFAVREAEQEREKLQGQFDSGATYPGQYEAAQKHHQLCQQALLGYPSKLLQQPYDADAHLLAEEQMRRREDAEEARRSNEQTAARLQEAEDALSRATRQFNLNKERLQELDNKLAALADVVEAVRGAEDQLAALERDEAGAMDRWRAAASAHAQAEAALAVARDKVQQAMRRAEKIAALRHDQEVAGRTEGLLRSTRDEITGESCPRLSEMIDGWARSLMGSHFSRVQLTADYRIEADNGSGMHTIEHFSGGEQTLLAVMLRVAISLYCQERSGMGAGFLVLDEVFGDQDELHRAQLVQFLNEIKPHYSQVIIVNHVQDVTDRLGSIIEVVATGEKNSRAVLRP